MDGIVRHKPHQVYKNNIPLCNNKATVTHPKLKTCVGTMGAHPISLTLVTMLNVALI